MSSTRKESLTTFGIAVTAYFPTIVEIHDLIGIRQSRRHGHRLRRIEV